MVEYAGETQPGGVYVTDASISVTGTTVRYSGFSGMYLTGDGRFSSFVNNTLTNNDLYPIVIAANYAGDLTTSNSYTGNATDQINVTADIIDRAATWQDLGIPYYVSGIGSVQNNGALTLAPGASLLFAAAGGFKVGAAGTGTGTLIADGSLGQITMGPAVATTNWVGIQFLDNATSTSLLDSCLIDMAGLRQSASFQGGINLTNCQVHIRHCTITRSGAVGIGFAGSAYPASMEENTITTSGSVPVSIDCDYVGYLPANNDFTGNTVNAFNLVGTAITRSATWSNPGIPFVITAVITINSGAQLTINPGLVLQFKSGSGMVVAQNATLTADGSEDQIQFVAEASGTNWEGLQFMSGSSSSSLLRACLIDEGGYQREYDASRNRYPGCVYIDNDSHPCLENCTISGSKKYGIFCKGTGYPDCFTGNVFVDNDGPPVRVEPDGVGHLKAANSFTGNVSDVIEIGGSLDNTARLGILGSTATWVDVGIPYWIEDSVRVQGGIQLTIGAGVTLQIVRPMNFGVCCGASIVCNGTAADPITFTATVNNWGKLYLQGSGNDNSVFNYCVFDRAGRDQSCGVELTNCSPSITNCTFSNTFSRACALCLIGTANPYLNNNTFTNNPGGNTCNR